jgi:hypothetical protein
LSIGVTHPELAIVGHICVEFVPFLPEHLAKKIFAEVKILTKYFINHFHNFTEPSTTLQK